MLKELSQITFANKWVLYLIPAVFVLYILWWAFLYRRSLPALRLSTTNALSGSGTPFKAWLKRLIPFLRVLAISSLLVALARPQSSFDEEKVTSEGIDIVLAVDVSTSMLAKDFSPNRLEAAKKEGTNFIDGRTKDRIGLVIFSGESSTQCPVTIDHNILKSQLKQVKNGTMDDGTAIGMGLGTAVQRLKEVDGKSKVVILMTDGVNNKGVIDPATATDIAVQFGIRVYTIGVGNNGMAMTPVNILPNGEIIFDYAEVQIDEALLKDIAKKTGGQYFRATDNKRLKDIYSQIDKLEKTKIEVSAFQHKTDKFYPLVLLAIGLFLLEVLMRYLIVKSIP